MSNAPQLDRLTGQLHHLPAIVGRFGLSLAEAQKEFNADYLASLTQIVQLAAENSQAAKDEQRLQLILDVVRALAPSRYQFTESTLEFSADLSESKSMAASVELGAGLSGVMVNAGFSMAYGYDYRASARLTTVLHAYPMDKAQADALLARAKELNAKAVELPERTSADKDVAKNLTDFVTLVNSKKP